MSLRLTRLGLQAPASNVAQCRAEFLAQRCAYLPGFLEHALLQYLLRHIAGAQFILKNEIDTQAGTFGQTLFVPLNEPAWFLLHRWLNQPAMFQLIAEITGCALPQNFFGRIHRSLPGAAEQRIDWHRDTGDHRLTGFWLNLSKAPWCGGLFQLREHGAPDLLAEIGGETAPGDAFLFSLAPELEHRATPVTAGGARTVGVGWFRAQPDQHTFASTYFPAFGPTARTVRRAEH